MPRRLTSCSHCGEDCGGRQSFKQLFITRGNRVHHRDKNNPKLLICQKKRTVKSTCEWYSPLWPHRWSMGLPASQLWQRARVQLISASNVRPSKASEPKQVGQTCWFSQVSVKMRKQQVLQACPFFQRIEIAKGEQNNRSSLVTPQFYEDGSPLLALLHQKCLHL